MLATLARGARRVLPALGLLVAAAACTTRDPEAAIDTRMWTDDLAFRIRLTPRPPFAREDIIVKVVVSDKESGAPVENGEGRIYAMSHDSTKVFDGLERGPEPGTYYAKLNFLTAGEWAIGLQFRRDSTKKLETMDWLQTVRNAR
ncbi:MAG: hypothetical protein IT355_09485 [Gemmatimonadaceae bacterium]|nr:hypothetical protein [Gemmatimonadaceae bacterium]